jgi:hypothetical protein
MSLSNIFSFKSLKKPDEKVSQTFSLDAWKEKKATSLMRIYMFTLPAAMNDCFLLYAIFSISNLIQK